MVVAWRRKRSSVAADLAATRCHLKANEDALCYDITMAK